MITKIPASPGVLAHQLVYAAIITSAQVRLFDNNTKFGVQTKAGLGVVDNCLFTNPPDLHVVVMLPPGNWKCETSLDGRTWRTFFTFPSVAPDNFRANFKLDGLPGGEYWQRWTKQ